MTFLLGKPLPLFRAFCCYCSLGRSPKDWKKSGTRWALYQLPIYKAHYRGYNSIYNYSRVPPCLTQVMYRFEERSWVAVFFNHAWVPFLFDHIDYLAWWFVLWMQPTIAAFAPKRWHDPVVSTAFPCGSQCPNCLCPPLFLPDCRYKTLNRGDEGWQPGLGLAALRDGKRTISKVCRVLGGVFNLFWFF